MLDHYLPRYPHFCVSLRLLHVRIYFFRVMCVPQTVLNLPYFPYTHKNISRILGISKTEEYADKNFHFQQSLETLKGQYFEKMSWWIKYWPRMNSLQTLFFGYLKKFCSLRLWRIRNTVNNKKSPNTHKWRKTKEN